MAPGLPTAIALMLAQMAGQAGIQAKMSEGEQPTGFNPIPTADLQSLLDGLVKQPTEPRQIQPRQFKPLTFDDLIQRRV